VVAVVVVVVAAVVAVNLPVLCGVCHD